MEINSIVYNKGFIFCTVFAVLVVTSCAQTTLEVVWMVPFDEHPTASFEFNASSCVGALAFGLETVKNQSILPAHILNVTVIDTQCNSKQSLGQLVDLMFVQNIDVVIGPPCAQVVAEIGELMAYQNTAIINWVTTGQTKDYSLEMDTYIKTMAPMSSLGGIMMSFFFYTKWQRFIIISTTGDDYVATANTIKNNIKLNEINGLNIAHHYSEIKTNTSALDIDEILSNIIHEGRIIILIIPRDELRKYMLRAHVMGMTSGDYQFLYTEVTLADQKDEEFINSDKLWRVGDGDDEAAHQAFENVLYFLLGHRTIPVNEWKDVANDSYYRMFAGRNDVPEPTEPSEFASYLHDTVILYARLMNRSLSMNKTGSGHDLFALTHTQYFQGLSGDVVMNERGERMPIFYVYDLNRSGVFHQVASLFFVIDPIANTQHMKSSFTSILWGDGRTSDDYIPDDTPACGFFDEFCPEDVQESKSYTTVIIAVSISMLVVILALYIIYRWWRSEQDLQNMAWKLNIADLNFNLSRKGHSSMFSRSSAPSNGSDSSGTVKSAGMLSSQSARPSIARGQIFTTVAMYKGEIVSVKGSKKKKVTMDRSFLQQMKHLVELKHANLTNFIGVCTVPEKICSVWEYCNKGSIQDVIENDDIRLDTMFKLSLAVDICQGIEYIHKCPIKFHGNLRSSNCVIDSRWVCKLTDFGLKKIQSYQEYTIETLGEHAFYTRLFWTAPEMLLKILNKDPVDGSQLADIYALGVIIKELVCRNEPYCDAMDLQPKDIIMKVAYPVEGEPKFRPVISDTELETEYRRKNMEYLIQRCWAEDVDDRPHIKGVLRTLNKINPYKKSSVVDNMIAMMEKYTNNLEEVVAERTEQLQEEKRKTDALLYRMLPKKVADDLKFGRSVQAEAFDSVTIYFSDIVEFTNLASQSTPLEIVALLNALYTVFDDIISTQDVYKVETIGDAYMIVSGLPEKNGPNHVSYIARVALEILQSVLTFQIPHKPDHQLQIRIGLHTGSVVAGVVGLTMPRYCLFGDTVNTASRMESNGKPLRIHMSPQTHQALIAFPEFIIEDRGEIPIKGKGMMYTYWLTGICENDICIEAGTLDVHTHPRTDHNDENQERLDFDKLIKPDQPSGDTADGMPVNNDVTLKVMDGAEGKVSVADSGICMDKYTDDKEAYRSDFESDKEMHILDFYDRMGVITDEEFHSEEIDIIRSKAQTKRGSDASDKLLAFNTNPCEKSTAVKDKKGRRKISLENYKQKKSIPMAVLNIADQIFSANKKDAALVGQTQNVYKDYVQDTPQDKEIIYANTKSAQKSREKRPKRRVSIQHDVDHDTPAPLMSTGIFEHDHIDAIPVSLSEEDDVLPSSVTRGTSIFNVPARVSATDFMSVQSNWERTEGKEDN